MHTHPIIILLALLTPVAISACKQNDAETIQRKYNADSIPSIDTDSVVTYITDSGRVKYKIATPQSQIFDKADDPHWFFPHGIYLEEYDSLFAVKTSIKADSAWNYTRRDTWKLQGNVVIKNTEGTIFRTEELFWDQRYRKIYTEKFITIISPERTLQGYGLDAKQDLTSFKILHPTGTMQVDENQGL